MRKDTARKMVARKVAELEKKGQWSGELGLEGFTVKLKKIPCTFIDSRDFYWVASYVSDIAWSKRALELANEAELALNGCQGL